MCGIIAVVRRPGARLAASAAEVTEPLHEAVAALAGGLPLAEACQAAAEHVEQADALLRGAEGVWALVHDRRLLAEVEGVCTTLVASLAAIEASLDSGLDGADGAAPDGAAPGGTPPRGAPDGSGAGPRDAAALEAVNAAVIRLKDATWAVEKDRVRTARAVADLAGSEPGWGATEAYTSIQQALSAIDRLEVRGRDSAGLHVLVRDHGLDVDSPAVAGLLRGRAADPLFRSGTVRVVDGCLSFVYKAAAEIGELGDNTRALRDALRADDLLRLAVASDRAVGRRPRAHPVGLGGHHQPAQRPPGRQRRGG